MSAQAVESTPLPKVPNNIVGIRAVLPERRRAEFDAELLEAADRDSLDAIRAFRRRWWNLAAFETNPALRDLPENEPMFPSPFRR